MVTHPSGLHLLEQQVQKGLQDDKSACWATQWHPAEAFMTVAVLTEAFLNNSFVAMTAVTV